MLRFLTAGESHGPELTAILEGMPAGLALAGADINADLACRQQGAGSGPRMAIEKDTVRITGGVMAGLTTGGPIAMVIRNRDFQAWRERDIPPMTIPRPGHVDLNAALKYGYSDLRLGLERASARETAARVAVGAICRKLLAEFGIVVGSYTRSIGAVQAEIPAVTDYTSLFSTAESDAVRCPDAAASRTMVAAINQARELGETLGGVIECVTLNLPPGLGSHVSWDRRLSGRLMFAVGSVPAIKGVQIGTAFTNTQLHGTQVHDAIVLGDSDRLERHSNRAGGLEGGITTGGPLVIQAAMKPISTTMKGIESVDLADGRPAPNKYERSDVCAVPRAGAPIEAMVSFVLADALMEKLGGDSISEMAPRFGSLKAAVLQHVNMMGTPWRFGFEEPE